LHIVAKDPIAPFGFSKYHFQCDLKPASIARHAVHITRKRGQRRFAEVRFDHGVKKAKLIQKRLRMALSVEPVNLFCRSPKKALAVIFGFVLSGFRKTGKDRFERPAQAIDREVRGEHGAVGAECGNAKADDLAVVFDVPRTVGYANP
jgi:hypothetical protein